jgi:hypothetical protein
MTLAEQISLIDEMIRENPDYTIRDFLDLMKEIQSVADSMKIKNHHFIFHQTITANDHYRKTHTPLRFYSR